MMKRRPDPGDRARQLQHAGLLAAALMLAGCPSDGLECEDGTFLYNGETFTSCSQCASSRCVFTTSGKNGVITRREATCQGQCVALVEGVCGSCDTSMDMIIAPDRHSGPDGTPVFDRSPPDHPVADRSLPDMAKPDMASKPDARVPDMPAPDQLKPPPDSAAPDQVPHLGCQNNAECKKINPTMPCCCPAPLIPFMWACLPVCLKPVCYGP